jgi:hypothetical protein
MLSLIKGRGVNPVAMISANLDRWRIAQQSMTGKPPMVGFQTAHGNIV